MNHQYIERTLIDEARDMATSGSPLSENGGADNHGHGSSTVTRTHGITHSNDGGSGNTCGLALGTAGTWATSSGSGDSTGTTQDNWGYGGTTTDTTGVPLATGTYTNANASSLT